MILHLFQSRCSTTCTSILHFWRGMSNQLQSPSAYLKLPCVMSRSSARKVKYNFCVLSICSKEMSNIWAARVNERMTNWNTLINESRICLVKTAQPGFMLMLLMSGLFLHRKEGRISSLLRLLNSFCSLLPPGADRRIRGVGEQQTVPCTSDLQPSRQLPASAHHQTSAVRRHP